MRLRRPLRPLWYRIALAILVGVAVGFAQGAIAMLIVYLVLGTIP